MRAFKYVDAEYADSFERGCLRIGTFESFAQIEGALRDAGEGRVSFVQHAYYPDRPGDHSIERSQLSRFGLGTLSPNAFMLNNTFVEVILPLFCFCLTNEPHDDFPGFRHKVPFEITGVRSLIRRVSKVYTSKLTSASWGRVHYRPGTVDWLEQHASPSPFVKDVSFAGEDEYRVCWQPRSYPIEAFNTDRDAVIASLIRRVG